MEEELKSKRLPAGTETIQSLWVIFAREKGFAKTDTKELAQMRHDILWFNRWLLEKYKEI